MDLSYLSPEPFPCLPRSYLVWENSKRKLGERRGNKKYEQSGGFADIKAQIEEFALYF